MLAGCNPPARPAGDGLRERNFVEVLRIGSRDEPGQTLEDIGGLTVDDDGNVYLLERRQATIRVFSSDGDALRTIGRRGAGPGEFQLPVSIGWRDGRLWVVDAHLRRVTYVDPTGQDPVTVPQPAVSGVPDRMRVMGFLPLSDDQYFVVTGYPQSMIADGLVTSRELLTITPEGSIRDTVATVPITETERIEVRDGERRIHLTAPPQLQDSPLFAVAPTGDRIAIVERDARHVGDAAYRLTVLTSQGDTVWSRERMASRTPLTSAFVESTLDMAFPPGEEGGLTIVDRAAVRRALPIPETVPAVSRVVLDDMGRVWIGREDNPTREEMHWEVFSPEGVLESRTVIPRTVRVLRIWNDRIYGRTLDEFHVPYVVVLAEI